MSVSSTSTRPDHEVVVIGAGPGGIAAGAKLKKAGITDFVILDRSDAPGGTWQHYTYPGISVDTPVLFYQYTFEPDPNWPRLFPSGAELQAYHLRVARKYGLDAHFRVNTEVVREVWDDREHCWRLHLADGTVLTARFVISGIGAFVTPKDAPLPGLDTFEGFIQRPGRWDNSFDHRGKKVAIVGTGASAVQIIAAIAPEVQRLTVFQRTPPWCLPRPNVLLWPIRPLLYVPGLVTMVRRGALSVLDIASRRIMHWQPSDQVTVPAMQRFDRGARILYRAYLFAMVRNRQARRGLMPSYGPLTKRPTANSRFLPSFNRDNVELVTEAVDHFTERGVVSASGREVEADMVIMATGHEMYSEPMDYRIGQIVGRDGFDLAAFWREHGMQAYDSCSVPGVPNRFMLSGPYSWYAIDWHEIVERGADHAVHAITLATQRKATMMEVRKDVHDAFHAEQYRAVSKVLPYFNTVNKHVNTYYRNSHGDFPFPLLGGVFNAEHRARNFPADVYEYSTVPVGELAGERAG
ncbi:NAD(P)/FAD-dependent oxidoreductase [Nocardia sp. 2]|uniref:NAD(P)/FAD-dependent oxidoreductase n=1 Tax=Nocardia acididurans TaxID=2802282 RepID=A0ABS1MDE6_9NOCA|nr:NAD(P)/FAD-dependent oxidoreductase [Nocardia acididurans]MBL1078100.1 NAD(P)/FAD-dependent oxidoreductase [Nocardia acididurans]